MRRSIRCRADAVPLLERGTEGRSRCTDFGQFSCVLVAGSASTRSAQLRVWNDQPMGDSIDYLVAQSDPC
jgi:hypothetical protein